MLPQEADSKYKNIITGYEVDDISKGKSVPLCSPWTKRIRKLEWFQFS